MKREFNANCSSSSSGESNRASCSLRRFLAQAKPKHDPDCGCAVKLTMQRDSRCCCWCGRRRWPRWTKDENDNGAQCVAAPFSGCVSLCVASNYLLCNGARRQARFRWSVCAPSAARKWKPSCHVRRCQSKATPAQFGSQGSSFIRPSVRRLAGRRGSRLKREASSRSGTGRRHER